MVSLMLSGLPKPDRCPSDTVVVWPLRSHDQSRQDDRSYSPALVSRGAIVPPYSRLYFLMLRYVLLVHIASFDVEEGKLALLRSAW
jgi:hypothetical protein